MTTTIDESGAIGAIDARAAIDAIMTRRSVRSFDARTVSNEDLETILAAGFAAPSAHGQEDRFAAVIDDRAARERIVSALPWFKPILEAPAAILVCGNPARCKQAEYWQVDCAAFAQNILLASRALGLGTVWCGIAPVAGNDAAIRSALDIPAPLVPFAAIAVGYPAKADAFREKERSIPADAVARNPAWIKGDRS